MTSPSPLGAPPQSHTGSPTDFLKGVVGKRVIVRLTSGVDYKGLVDILSALTRHSSHSQAFFLVSMGS